MKYIVIVLVVVVALVTLYLVMKPKVVKDDGSGGNTGVQKEFTPAADVEVTDLGADTGGTIVDINKYFPNAVTKILPQPTPKNATVEGGYNVTLRPSDFNTVLP
jgi:hypothetical protein